MLNINDNTLLVNNEIIKIKTKKNKINKYGFDIVNKFSPVYRIPNEIF